MKVPAFLRAVIESFNPIRYKGLTQRSLPKTFAYFFIISIVYVLILGIINIPSYRQAYNDFDSTLGSFEKLEINFDIKTKEPVTLSKSPKIVVDTSGRNISNEDILIGESNITKKFFFWQKSVQVNHINLLENIDNVKRNTLLLVLLFVPTIIAVVYSFVIIKYLIIVVLSMILGALIVLLFGQKSSFIEVFKAAMYAITIYYASNLVLSIFGIKYLGLVIYAIFFVLVLVLMREEKFEFVEDDEG